MSTARRYDKAAVHQQLMEEIVSGVLAPGTPLPERSLVERFGISRTPIRQVLWMLKRDGLIDIHANRGAFVKKLGAGEVLELFQLREALEPLAARLAAIHGYSLEISSLKARMIDANANPDEAARSLVALGSDLHDSIAEWSGNQLLQRIYEMLRMRTHLLRNLLHGSEETERASLSEHIEILSMIEARNPNGAYRAMASHLERARLAIIGELFSTPGALSGVAAEAERQP